MITEDIRRFILTSIPSVPHLEALLLLRSEAGAEWEDGELARRLYVSEQTARTVLADLSDAGFVVRASEGGSVFRYQPGSEAQAEIVGKIADAYASNLVEVTNLIHGRSALLFADAFRLRRD